MENLQTASNIKEGIIVNINSKGQSIPPAYIFKGDSMLDYSKNSILDGDKIYYDNDNLINSLIIEALKPNNTDAFVIHPFVEEPFLACIKSVESEKDLIEFTFLNPDKIEFPDKTIQVDNIKAAFRVIATSRLMRSYKSEYQRYSNLF